MSSSQHPLRQSGIYRNLPSFDPSVKNLKTIVCGATGISGFHTIRALLDTPERWSTIYALSRSPLSNAMLSLLTEQQRARIQHVSIDLSSSSEQIAQTLKDAHVQVDYIFYYAYLPPKTDKSAMDPSTAEDLLESNVPPFQNLLASFPLANLKPKRILLQTGGKNYGMHIGRVRTPLVESDPQPRHLGPNFYYPQEDALREYCTQHPETDWNIVRPAAVIGATQYASMNTFVAFGIYAAVQAHRNQPLYFGSDWNSWQFDATNSSARMTGYLSEWAVLEDACKNQAFNSQDGGLLSMDRFFGELARWYGVEGVMGPVWEEEKKKQYTTQEFAGGEDAPIGYGPPLVLRQSSTLVQWAEEAGVKETWEEMMRLSDGQLKTNVFGGNARDLFMMGDFQSLPFGTLSMNKVRRFGFSGFVDTLESIFETFQEMAKLGVLPCMKVDAARPLI
jgi:nucleoside-diphosphate-sugar epimerase